MAKPPAPLRGMHSGDVVPVKGRGVPPLVQVRVIQCDTFTGDPDAGDCADAAVTTASSCVTVALSLTLADPVYRIEPFGDPMLPGRQVPHLPGLDRRDRQRAGGELARARLCRLARDDHRHAGERAAGQPARCTWSAPQFGARGHTVGPYGELAVVAATVRRDGTFAAD
jgi:hypothetical protein